MLNGVEQPPATAVAPCHDVGILQSVAQKHSHALRLYTHHHALEQYTPAHVGLFVFRISVYIHHVSAPEVGREVVAAVGNVECQHVVAACRLVYCESGKLQSHVHASGVELLLHTHAPHVSHATARSGKTTRLRQLLLFEHKGHHAAQIGAFQRWERRQRRGHLLKLRQQISVIKETAHAVHVERFGRQPVYRRGKTVACHGVLLRHNEIAEGYCLAQFSLKMSRAYESLGHRILRVEQHDLDVLPVQTEVVFQHSVIKQQLDIMFFKILSAAAVLPAKLYVSVSARLLLHEHASVGRHHVHTSLHTEHLTHERRLEKHFRPVVYAEQG